MTNRETGKPVCEMCGQPASYRETHRTGTDDLCEVCVNVAYGDRQGSRFALAEAFMAIANMAHGGGLTVEDLHRCVDTAVKDERITLDVPWLESLAADRRAERSWRRLQPIEG